MRRGASAAGVVTLAVLAGLAACVSSDEVGGSNNPSPTTTSIVAQEGVVGTDVTGGGVTATVVDVMPFDQSPVGVPRVSVVMRSENVTDHVVDNPDLRLLCDESTKSGDWYRGSTWEPNTLMPVNRVAQGEVIIGFPLKSDNSEYPVVTCTHPRLRLTLGGVRGAAPVVTDFAVSTEVISEALRRPRGATLPVASESK